MDCDVLVIGAGAGGAGVALGLAEKGFDVICLEQGDWIAAEDLPKRHADWEVRGRHGWHTNPSKRQWDSDYPVHSVGETPVDPMLYNAVGGSTVGFGGAYWRFLPSDFRTRTLDGVGVDWPISYEELAPYYSANERIIGMSGFAGDPTAPEREEVPLPPVSMGRLGHRWASAFNDLGWYWWVQDCAISTTDYGAGRHACIGRGSCRFGCPSRALSTVDVTYWPRALERGVKLRTVSRVQELLIDPQGLARGALVADDAGRLSEVTARIVVLSAGGLGTPRLLLLSRSSLFPDGLANSSGLVGKNLMLHVHALVTGLFPDGVDGDHGAWGGSVSSREFYETRHENDYVRGFSLGGRRGVSPLQTALQTAPWGSEHHHEMERRLNHEAVVAVIGDDEPEITNEVRLDWDHVDTSGMPGIEIDYRLSENSRRLGRDGIRRAEELCRAAGAISVRSGGLTPVTGWHLMGTARMGSDPANSVVDADHRSHDVPNLFIVDSSSLPTGGAVNPTNTIQALALRAADQIHTLTQARRITVPV